VSGAPVKSVAYPDGVLTLKSKLTIDSPGKMARLRVIGGLVLGTPQECARPAHIFQFSLLLTRRDYDWNVSVCGKELLE